MTVTACPACMAGDMAQDVAAHDGQSNIVLSVPTMHCAACISAIENGLRAVPGVINARVNLSQKRVFVQSQSLDAYDVQAAITKLGYEAFPLDQSHLEPAQDKAGRALLTRVGVAGFAMMNVMLLSVSVWSGAESATRDAFHLISSMIAVPAVIYAAQPFFTSAFRVLRHGKMNMDVPIALAILLATVMSLYESLQGGEHAYFDAALALTFFLLIGRYLDYRTRAAARSAARELSALETKSAFVMRGEQIVEIPSAQLVVGDIAHVPSGAVVPADGVLTSREGLVDRAFLTGESDPVQLAEGDTLSAGELNLSHPFALRITATGEDTTLRQMTEMVSVAESARNRFTSMADRAAKIYAPMVHLLALAAFLAWFAISRDMRLSLNIAVAVLIITCPCALGLAVPAVATQAISKLYDLGFLVKDGRALERLAETDVVVFDKTGTLTTPVAQLEEGEFTHWQRSALAAVAAQSRHPVARACAEALRDVAALPLEDVREDRGNGVSAVADGITVRFGHGQWLGAEFTGPGVTFGDEFPIAIDIREGLRPGMEDAVQGFRARGFDLVLLSGDRAEAVDRVSRALGIADAHGGLSPAQKTERIAAFQAQGRKVLMVGDGLNDTAALAAADASIAPASALEASRTVADLVFVRDDFASLPKAYDIATQYVGLSVQNFRIASVYNLIAVPVALLGFATPFLAAIAMSTSSISVIVNAFRLKVPK